MYFADDDNFYSSQIFNEFLKLEQNDTMGMFPVGLVGGSSWEGPICDENNTIVN